MGMLVELEFFGEINWLTVLIRLILAIICGGLVGFEREMHGRAAGLRTHMMVAVGSALTTLLGVFNVEVLGVSWADPMRIGAQVISGIGFLGAGTILLKKGSNQITGLTTAAGLWVTAVSGLAAGAGFYEGAIFVAILTTLIFNMVSRLEFAMNSKRQRVVMYLEIDSVEAVPLLTDTLMSSFGAKEVQVTPPRSGTVGNVGMEALVHIPKHVTGTQKKNELQKLEHVVFALRM